MNRDGLKYRIISGFFMLLFFVFVIGFFVSGYVVVNFLYVNTFVYGLALFWTAIGLCFVYSVMDFFLSSYE